MQTGTENKMFGGSILPVATLLTDKKLEHKCCGLMGQHLNLNPFHEPLTRMAAGPTSEVIACLALPAISTEQRPSEGECVCSFQGAPRGAR